MRVAFTGHRPEQLNIQQDELSQSGQALQDLIWQEIWTQEKAGADIFGSTPILMETLFFR